MNGLNLFIFFIPPTFDPMIFMAILYMLLLSGSAFLFIYFYIRYHQPSQAQIDTDIAHLAAILDRPEFQLAPWDTREMDLLCQLPYLLKKQRGWRDLQSGLLKTIYNEPIVSWASFNYKSPSPNVLVVCRISGWSQALILRIKKNQGFVFKNAIHQATIDPDWTFYNPRKNEIIGLLKTITDSEDAELFLFGRKRAILNKPGISRRLKPKVFTWIDDLSQEETDWIQAITALWLILQHQGLQISKTAS